jgi:hypothetical protein
MFHPQTIGMSELTSTMLSKTRRRDDATVEKKGEPTPSRHEVFLTRDLRARPLRTVCIVNLYNTGGEAGESARDRKTRRHGAKARKKGKGKGTIFKRKKGRVPDLARRRQ